MDSRENIIQEDNTEADACLSGYFKVEVVCGYNLSSLEAEEM